MKIGLVYYSRTGNTRQVAEMLEKKLKEKKAEVDLIEIEHVKKPGFFAAGKAGTKQLELPMKNTDFNMGNYDSIIAGSPTWNKRPSPFIITFINKAENMKGKKIAVFSTGLSPIADRGLYKEILKTNLEKAGVKPFDSFLALQFKKDRLVDGDQNIDNFVNSVLKM
ncbi:MAG: flavodoxin family protein [Candidatus Thermoplasmatota archaeon]